MNDFSAFLEAFQVRLAIGGAVIAIIASLLLIYVKRHPPKKSSR